MAQFGHIGSAAASNPAPTNSSAEPPSAASGADAAAATNQHKRVYQACIPCRRRKVRCDLGSVDNPRDPPCVRCRRESKECFFSATRRKRKTDDGFDPDEEQEIDEYIVRNGRKRPHTRRSPSISMDRRLYSEVPLTPGGSHGRLEPLRKPHSSRSSTTGAGSLGAGDFAGAPDDSNAQLENLEAQAVMRQGVFGPHDALDLLYKAATDSTPVATNNLESKSISTTPAVMAPSSQPAPRPNPLSGPPRHSVRREKPTDPRSVKPEAAIDPALMNGSSADDPGYAEALRAWARFRFVRAGWFTAQEAIQYIEYYYKFLSPLTPISPPTFSTPSSHLTLLTEEPVLAITLLTIASRYCRLQGTGGHCRSNAIHEQLWTYLRGMIERCLWGQESFGGGFCAPVSTTDDPQSSSTAPWRGLRKGSLRTLGTIESLMILTEWHPRALHFPPAEAMDELMLPSYESPPYTMGTADDADGNQRMPMGVGGRRIESWLEPAWRSDRMCWMLLSTALGLAYELGVFDDIDELLRDGAITRPEYEEETYRQRAYRIKRLLLIYLTQLAGRLGWTTMVPDSLRKSDPAVSRRRPTSVEGTTPGTNLSSLSNAFNYIPDLELDDQIIHCWAGISNAMHMGNEKLFRSRKHTTDIIQSGKYVELLKDFQPLLRDWWKEFERFRLPMYIRHILTIEFEYVRIYVNSLSLQAVVERCASAASGGPSSSSNHVGTGVPGPGGIPHVPTMTGNSAGGTQLSPQTQNYFGKLPLGQLGGFSAADQEYIKEVVEGSRNLLRTVVEGLLPGDYLKHAPVRTYFRIISGAMFLLKTFALGAPRSDVKVSIDLMDRTVEALRNCVVDDVHLGIRFADLLDSLTSRLRTRFIQAPPHAQTGSGGARSPSGLNGDNQLPNGGGPASGQGNGNGTAAEQASWAVHAAKLRNELTKHTDRPPSPQPNISATPFDTTTGLFPYHSGAASAINPSTPAPLDGTLAESNIFDDWNNPNNEMWYLPTGPSFFQNMDNNTVAMTAEGVNVGGMDLLDYMTMDNDFTGMGHAYS